MAPKAKDKFNMTNNRLPNKLLYCYTRLYNSRAEHNKDNNIPELPDNIMPNTIFYIKDWDLYVPNTKIYRDGLSAEFDFKIEKGNQIAVKKATVRTLTEDTNKIIVSLVAPEIEPQNKNVVESFINVYKSFYNIPEVIEIEPEKSLKQVKKYGKPKDKETRDKESEKKLLDYKKMITELDEDMKLLIKDIDKYDEKLNRKDLTQKEYDLFEDLRDKALKSLKILERDLTTKKKDIPEDELIKSWVKPILPVLFTKDEKYKTLVKHIEEKIKEKKRFNVGDLFTNVNNAEGKFLLNKLFSYYHNETDDGLETIKIIDTGMRDIVKYLDGEDLINDDDNYKSYIPETFIKSHGPIFLNWGNSRIVIEALKK